MSGNLLSAYRTGAVPNVGVKHLAREDVTTLAIIGPGVMARTTAEGVLALRPGITTVKVKGRGAASAQRFAEELAAKHPQLSSVVVVDTDGTVLHSQLVPEITTEPDYDAAIAALA